MFINERYDFAGMTSYNVPGPNDVGIGPILGYRKDVSDFKHKGLDDPPFSQTTV
jgi:hypothetical protein